MLLETETETVEEHDIVDVTVEVIVDVNDVVTDAVTENDFDKVALVV